MYIVYVNGKAVAAEQDPEDARMARDRNHADTIVWYPEMTPEEVVIHA